MLSSYVISGFSFCWDEKNLLNLFLDLLYDATFKDLVLQSMMSCNVERFQIVGYIFFKLSFPAVSIE